MTDQQSEGPIASTTSTSGSVPAAADAAGTGGKHDGELLNTSGNARNGQLFQIVERHGRTFHVYGSGSHRLFIGMPVKTGGTEAAS